MTLGAVCFSAPRGAPTSLFRWPRSRPLFVYDGMEGAAPFRVRQGACDDGGGVEAGTVEHAMQRPARLGERTDGFVDATMSRAAWGPRTESRTGGRTGFKCGWGWLLQPPLSPLRRLAKVVPTEQLGQQAGRSCSGNETGAETPSRGQGTYTGELRSG